MPRTNLPTPAPSTDIPGKDGSPTANEGSFHLPPPAIVAHRTNATSAQRQIQPATNLNFSLPPPPTRSRTIIQMKPKAQHSQESVKPTGHQNSRGSNKKAASGTSGTTGKKQPSTTSVAGKKIARKTAHSVIERRRRSKMNEEFGVLKAMIPACTDQEMHKLAILQASIDYLRYLENCITELKAANNSLSTPLVQPQAPPPRADDDNRSGYPASDSDTSDEDSDPDLPMTEPLPPPDNHTFSVHNPASAYTSPQSITNSPTLDNSRPYQSPSSASSITTLPSPTFGPQQHFRHEAHHNRQQHHARHHSTNTSLPSPVFRPQPASSHPRSHQSGHFNADPSASTSPTLMPSGEQDQEATAALLMLNQDRRNPVTRRGMSVKDLLSC